MSGEITLVFFDDRDAFGRYAPEPSEDGLILYKDLADAVGCLAARDSMRRVLSDTASQLLQAGILERGDGRTKRRLLHVLGTLGLDAAVFVPKLIELVSDENPRGSLKELAVWTLGRIGPGAAAAVPKLIEMAELDTANARAMCLVALEAIGPPAASAVPMLIDLLLRRASVDPDPSYVPMAADALGSIRAIEALPALQQVLQETDDPDVATAIVGAIGKLGPDAAGAAPILAVFAEDHPEGNRFSENAEIREAAREALRRVSKSRPVGPRE